MNRNNVKNIYALGLKFKKYLGLDFSSDMLKVARWLQTRETPELNFRNMLDSDVYTYRCGEVKPGGYTVNEKTVDSCKGGQFGVHELERRRFESMLKDAGFSVNYALIKRHTA